MCLSSTAPVKLNTFQELDVSRSKSHREFQRLSGRDYEHRSSFELIMRLGICLTSVGMRFSSFHNSIQHRRERALPLFALAVTIGDFFQLMMSLSASKAIVWDEY